MPTVIEGSAEIAHNRDELSELLFSMGSEDDGGTAESETEPEVEQSFPADLEEYPPLFQYILIYITFFF